MCAGTAGFTSRSNRNSETDSSRRSGELRFEFARRPARRVGRAEFYGHRPRGLAATARVPERRRQTNRVGLVPAEDHLRSGIPKCGRLLRNPYLPSQGAFNVDTIAIIEMHAA